MKISPAETEIFHADGPTGGHEEANSSFLKFCECVQKTSVDIFREVSRSFLV
jgi:hypothetical protein